MRKVHLGQRFVNDLNEDDCVHVYQMSCTTELLYSPMPWVFCSVD